MHCGVAYEIVRQFVEVTWLECDKSVMNIYSVNLLPAYYIFTGTYQAI